MSLATSSTVVSGVVVATALYMTSLALIGPSSCWAKLHSQTAQALTWINATSRVMIKMRNMSRWFIGVGLALVVVGLLWPWLGRLGLGRLPGDIVIERGNFRFYFPIVTCLVVSGVASLILWFLNR